MPVSTYVRISMTHVQRASVQDIVKQQQHLMGVRHDVQPNLLLHWTPLGIVLLCLTCILVGRLSIAHACQCERLR